MYIWSEITGQQVLSPFILSSTSPECSSNDYVYTMSVSGSAGGDTSFITFN